MPETRKIALYSGHRAEKGHIDAILAGVSADPRLQPVLIELPLAPHDDTAHGAAISLGINIQTTARYLKEVAPDILLLYGDRTETFAAAIAASQMGIPIAHCEGGDVTCGGLPDDRTRHAISALASLHLATNDASAARLRDIHDDWRVRNVGLPILDLAEQRDTPEMVREQFAIGMRPLVLFCLHPVPGEDAVEECIKALLSVKRWAKVIVLSPNDDPGSWAIRGALEKHFKIEPNMPQRTFHGLLAIASCFVGNSSAALKEAPYFNCPAVDIGDRQRGRLAGSNVTWSPPRTSSILNAIVLAIKKRDKGRCDMPYGHGRAGLLIAESLATVELGRLLKQEAA